MKGKYKWAQGILIHTCGTSIIAKVVPAMEKPTACPRFLSKNVFNATKADAMAKPVPKPIIRKINMYIK